MPRKTRKQKERARGRFESTPSGLVNREFTFSFNEPASTNFIAKRPKNTDLSSQNIDIRFQPSDLVKTVALALGVFVLELVLYFAWFKKSNVF